MNSNIDFVSVCWETILFSSIEISYFSSQLYFFLATIKSEIWHIYVIWCHHFQSTRGSYLPLLILSYKGISALYYSMALTIIWSLPHIWSLISLLLPRHFLHVTKLQWLCFTNFNSYSVLKIFKLYLTGSFFCTQSLCIQGVSQKIFHKDF